MRKIYALMTASALMAGMMGTASAADLMARKAPMPAVGPAWSWTGFYIGAHVGGATGTVETEISGFGLPLGSGQINGFIGGGQIGYNYQTGPLVFGIEADVSFSALEGTTSCLAFLSCKREADWFATFTGRVGFAVDRALIYVKGGAAYGNFNYETSFFGTPIGSGEEDRWGYTVGTGVEYAISSNWSAKLEYNFMDFGKETFAFNTAFGGGSIDIDSKQFIHAVKFGVNYRFGGGPIVGNY